MNSFSLFLYRHKIILLNLLLAGFIAGFNPQWLRQLPDTTAWNYYTGVFLILMMYFEFVSIHHQRLFIFSFSGNLHRRAPWYIASTFLPRVIVAGAFGTLAFKALGWLEMSDFFLLPLTLYATAKEFWVRSSLFDMDREKNPRPAQWKIWSGYIAFFIFFLSLYVSIWHLYLLENPRIMYLVLSPINWAPVALAFLGMLYSLEMHYFWEEYLRVKTRWQKWLSVLSLLLPVVALLAQIYMQGFVY